MNMSARLLLVSALFLLAKGRQLRSKEETLEMIHSLLSSPQSLARYSGGRPLSFSFSDCGGKNSTLIVQNLTLAPDPIVVPGNVTVGVNVTLKEMLSSPIKVAVTIKKKILGLVITIPCDKNFGSCTYDDACSILDKVKCPQQFIHNHLHCKCPFKPGNYSLPETSIGIALPSNLPSFLADGDYDIEAKIFDSKGAQAGCVHLDLSLKVKS